MPDGVRTLTLFLKWTTEKVPQVGPACRAGLICVEWQQELGIFPRTRAQ
jgi:hypothetical protein